MTAVVIIGTPTYTEITCWGAMPNQIVLNNGFDDATYDDATVHTGERSVLYAYEAGNVEIEEDGTALYAYAYPETQPGLGGPRTLDLTGRGQMYAVPTVTPPTVPRRTLPTNEVKVVEVRHINLWPIWLAIGVTAIIAIVALAQSSAPVAPAAEIRPTPAANGFAQGLNATTTMPTATPTPTAASSSVTAPSLTAPETTNSPLPPAGTCYCTSNTITFATANPGPCYVLADGTYGSPNLLQNGGLYIRPGPPGVAGVVIEQSTAVNGLAVNVSTQLESEWPDMYSEGCDGVEGEVVLPERAWLSWRKQAYNCSKTFTSTAALEGDPETRPPSIYLVPYMCR